jgi:hypothetical protein
MHLMKPPLPAYSLKSSGNPSFKDLWANPTWCLVSGLIHREPTVSLSTPCPICASRLNAAAFAHLPPEGASVGDLLPVVELAVFQFTNPGPCGRTLQSIWAGTCPGCDYVLWHMGPMYCAPWDDFQLEEISSAQEKDLTSYDPLD